MNRDYTHDELTKIVEYCLESRTNLLPFLCRENKDCWWIIKLCAAEVMEYNIIPEHYWHGNSKEFSQLLTLLSCGYPSPEALLQMASRKTSGEIQNVADYFLQHMNVMFEFVKQQHGYTVLRPTVYMQSLYPDSAEMLYVYTNDKWTRNDGFSIDGPFLTLKADEIGSLRELIRKKICLP